jgi:hypothetical protein
MLKQYKVQNLCDITKQYTLHGYYLKAYNFLGAYMMNFSKKHIGKKHMMQTYNNANTFHVWHQET